MWDVLLPVLGALADPHVILLIVLGTLFGIIAGALPGLTPPIAIALLLPLTFTLDPLAALVMLCAVYMAAEYGGSVSGILINTPGHGGAVCTALDGFPMAQQGRGHEALHASIIASSVGGLIGVGVLLAFTPPLAQFSLRFGPPEMFWLAILGLSLVCNLTAKSFLKGVIMAAFGLWIATIGDDLTTGYPRFTFGMPELAAGVALVPALMGFFAISQMLNLIGSRQGMMTNAPPQPGAFGRMLHFTFTRPVLLLRSSLIGVIVGILPGAGAAIASFVSYSEAQRSSRDPDSFGKGNPEGVIAAESANNAMVGGSLVPLLAFGIPGSASAAILFGALTMHGLIPGPRLFTERADIAYGFILGMFPAVIVMFAVGVLGARYFSAVLKIKTAFIIPTVLALTIIGSYSVRNSLLDVYIAAFCGILGYILLRLGFNLAPVVLGIILGPMAENAYNRSMAIAGTHDSVWLYWFSRPISIVLICLTAIIVLSAFWRDMRSRRAAARAPHPQEE